MGEGEPWPSKDNSKSEAMPSVSTGSLTLLALGSPLNWLNLVTQVTVFVGLKDHQAPPTTNQVRMRAVARSWERFVSIAKYVWKRFPAQCLGLYGWSRVNHFLIRLLGSEVLHGSLLRDLNFLLSSVSVSPARMNQGLDDHVIEGTFISPMTDFPLCRMFSH